MDDITLLVIAVLIFVAAPFVIVGWAVLSAMRAAKRDDAPPTGDGFNVESLREWRKAKWRKS
jgi:hypothetical protein